MKTHVLPTTLAALLLAMTGSAQDRPAPADRTSSADDLFSTERARALAGERRAAADVLMSALDEGADTPALIAAAERAMAALMGAPESRTRIEQAVAAARVGGEKSELERTLERAADDLRFRPYVEAELPLGWPDTAPVGEVVLKSYPRYRMARTTMASRGGMNTPFFALFNHIKRNDIAMTAPVQMDYAAGDASTRRTNSMAFLYSHPNLGEAGADTRDDRVEVIDVAPVLAISIGGRGYEMPQKSAEMRERLEAWLTAHRDEFEAAGPMRTMGYNSPMVPAARRFFEVEIPVRRIEKSAD